MLQSNNLYALPDCLSRLGSLTHLDVSANQLMRPSAGCGALTLLLEINLCDNNLHMLPSDLGLLLGSLETLRIAGNPLSLLPPALIQPDASDELLRYLLLCEQSITTLSLDISSRALGVIPGHVFDMLHLRVLNVADNGLTVLPDAIGRLNELSDLVLDDNRITALPLGFGECHRITRLSTLRMTLTSPPESILSRGVQVTREWIKRLCDASSSELSAGAEDEGLRLDLSSLALDGWPQELQSDAFSSLVRLSLIDNLLPEIPETIEFLSGLRSLQAGYNRCDSLPTQLGTLTNLTNLSIPFNLLADVPASICNVESLTEVNLDGNKFTVFPAVLCDCHSLKVLRLNQNQIEEINAAVGLLANLEDFQMSYNALHSIPPRISFCTALTRLRLSYNDIQHVPPELGECFMMQELHLTHNKLTTLPPTIGRMSSLRELQVAANFFKSPLSQIVQRGGGATMRYLREVLAGGVPSVRPVGAEDPFADPDAASGKKQVVQTRYSSLNSKK
jgi:leucine-rich repeat protein SHOC2